MGPGYVDSQAGHFILNSDHATLLLWVLVFASESEEMNSLQLFALFYLYNSVA